MVVKERAPRIVYYSLFTIGVTAISSQIILIREFFTVFYGNELSIGFVLAIWLLGGALGSGLLGYFFADKVERKLELFSVIQLAVSFLLPFSIIFARISRVVFGVGVGEIVSPPLFLIVSLISFLPLSILLGFSFVLGCRLIPQKRGETGIGYVYTIEALGSVFGGVLTSIVLINFLGAFEIACLLAGANLIFSFFLRRRALTLLLFVFLLTLAALGFVDSLDDILLKLRFKGLTVLESRDSIYGRITVTKRGDEINFFDNGLFLASSGDALSAEEAVHFPMLASGAAKKVLLIGGGAGPILSEILKYPVERVDYVELDPLLIFLSRKYLSDEKFYRLNDPRVKVINTDGRFYIKNTKSLYDAIIVNLPNPYTAGINRFYTREFFREARRIMRENSILGFSVSSSENYVSAEEARFLKSLFETASSEFADVKIVPGDTAHFLASPEKGHISLSHAELASRLSSLGINTFYVRDYYLVSKLSDERLKYLDKALAGAEAVPKNTDFRPISYFYDFVLWSAYFNFRFSKFLMFLTEKRLLLASIIFFLALFVVFILRRRKASYRKEVTLLALSTTGLSEISFEILIVLAFQIIYGYLYYKVGIIIASFMLGLVLGSFIVTKRLPGITKPFRAYVKIQALVLLYPLLLLGAIRILASLPAGNVTNRVGEWLFTALPLIAGFVGGMQYPLANKIYLAGDSSLGKSAGATYAADLLGSFLGALLLSAFFVPIVGIPVSCLLLVALNLVSFVLLLTVKAQQLLH